MQRWNHRLSWAGPALVAALLLGACTGAPAPIPTQAPAAAPAATQPAGEAAPIAADTPAPEAPATELPPAATSEPAPDATVVAEPPTVAPSPEATATLQAAIVIECTPGTLTPAQTEGPYYSANPPENASLFEEGMEGTRLTLTGYVLNADCEPIPGARVDFWQADAAGQYDNTGYRLRGYQLTDESGRYTLETVIPGEYPGRPPHIHVKVQPPGGAELTTQVYFPGVASNERDSFFNPALVVSMQEGPDGQVATFNFVLPAG